MKLLIWCCNSADQAAGVESLNTRSWEHPPAMKQNKMKPCPRQTVQCWAYKVDKKTKIPKVIPIDVPPYKTMFLPILCPPCPSPSSRCEVHRPENSDVAATSFHSMIPWPSIPPFLVCMVLLQCSRDKWPVCVCVLCFVLFCFSFGVYGRPASAMGWWGQPVRRIVDVRGGSKGGK